MEKQERYLIRQFSDWPNRLMTDKVITSFSVCQEATGYAANHNIEKDTNEVRMTKYGVPRHIGRYIHSKNEGWYVDDITKYKNI
jgi:hypothetical protein